MVSTLNRYPIVAVLALACSLSALVWYYWPDTPIPRVPLPHSGKWLLSDNLVAECRHVGVTAISYERDSITVIRPDGSELRAFATVKEVDDFIRQFQIAKSDVAKLKTRLITFASCPDGRTKIYFGEDDTRFICDHELTLSQ
jgi:hypothetical protein